jgi:hypothetical protein
MTNDSYMWIRGGSRCCINSIEAVFVSVELHGAGFIRDTSSCD